ncbi:MAG: UvrD-helicase domain-containing protein [Desulfovibrionaceae bacterium]|nr:UvrD-helicase domain-containing protein [Desulfovibrionaceae bacterium]
MTASQNSNLAAAEQPLLQIQASAGSGKTYDLTRRFLIRLQQAQADIPVACALGNAPEAWGDIIAITFTNAAAAEMKQRVITALKSIALGLERPEGVSLSPAEAKHRLAMILRNYSCLNIRTIDSLLHTVVRAAAIDLELPPEFEPVFATEEALAPVLDALLEDAQNNDTSPMYHWLVEACRSLVYESETKGFLAGEKLISRLRPLLDGALLHQYDELTAPDIVQQRLQQCRHEPQVQAQRLRGLVQEGGLSCNSRMLNALEKVAAGDTKALESAYWQKTSLDDCLNKASRGASTAAHEAAYAALCAAVQRYATQGKLLQGAVNQAPFITLAQALAAGFTRLITAEHKIPTVLMPYKALDVLEGEHGAPDVLCRMGSRLSHFLIDEFQDTSHIQWQAMRPLVVEALSRGGTLTWVGDVKQAIYSWRGGDSRLFDMLAHDEQLLCMLEKPQAGTAPLTTNWRSRTVIVEHNNAFFCQLAQPDVVKALLACTLPKEIAPLCSEQASADIMQAFTGTQQNSRSTPEAQGGFVNILPLEADNTTELREAVLERLLALLQEDIGLRRPWGDVAVLVRSNSTASTVAEALMGAGIPVVTENSLLLAEHPLIRQCMAFLEFLDNPDNDIAFLSFMTGSIVSELPEAQACGCTAAALTDLAAQEKRAPLYSECKKALPEIWRLFINPFINQAGLVTAYDLVQEWFARMDVLARFPAEDTFLRRFLEVLFAAEGRGYGLVPAFVAHWKERGGEEKVPMAEGLDAVQIMTIHKAKGLEFPIVIVPWMSFTHKVQPEPVRMECDNMVIMTPRRKETGKHYAAALSTAIQENLNLLYVAWTRAQDELYCFHTATPALRNSGSIIAAIDMLLEKANISLPYSVGQALPCPAKHQPALPQPEESSAQAQEPSPHLDTCQSCNEALLQQQKNSVQAAQKQTDSPSCKSCQLRNGASLPLPEENKARAAAQAQEPSPSPLPEQYLSKVEQPEEALPASPTAWRPMRWLPRLKVFRNPLQELEFSAKDRGTLMHACLEHLLLCGDPQRDKEHAALAVQQAMASFPKALPNDPALQASLTQAAQWFASLPQAAHWRHNAIPEQSILDEHGQQHRVDLLLEQEHDYLVIEYKTGQPQDSHIAQVRRYLGLLHRATGLPAQGVLIYLDLQQVRLVSPVAISALAPTLEHCLLPSASAKE